MYPHFKKKEYLPKEDYSLKLSLVMIFGIIFVSFCQAQQYPVTITIAVSPPYPPKVNEYIAQPNKIMATLVNTSAQARQVYVQGSITGEGSIKVFTDPNYKMPQPLTLQPGIPFQMNYYNIQQVFSSDHLVFQGITKNEILYGTGLPEGDYMICLQAFDYSTNQQVSQPSPQGCSNTFTVTSIEPPVVLQPICGEPVNPGHPQNIIFSWTRPPGAPVNTQFNLKIIEVLPTDRNINDAMRSATHPAFFETTIGVTSYILGPSDPQLVIGKKYAFAVTAIDPAGQATFRNHGMSEVCSFSFVNIVSNQAQQIILLTPKNESVIADTAITFSWQTINPAPGILFQLNICEVKPRQTKEEALKMNPSWFKATNLEKSFFIYPFCAKTFEKGKNYAWQVTGFTGNTLYAQSGAAGFFCKPGEMSSEEQKELLKKIAEKILPGLWKTIAKEGIDISYAVGDYIAKTLKAALIEQWQGMTQNDPDKVITPPGYPNIRIYGITKDGRQYLVIIHYKDGKVENIALLPCPFSSGFGDFGVTFCSVEEYGTFGWIWGYKHYTPVKIKNNDLIPITDVIFEYDGEIDAYDDPSGWDSEHPGGDKKKIRFYSKGGILPGDLNTFNIKSNTSKCKKICASYMDAFGKEQVGHCQDY